MTIAFGTFVHLEVTVPERDGTAALDSACSQFTHLEKTLHPTRGGSDLAAIAAALPGELTHVDATTFEVLLLARDVWARSNGLFDPCVPLQPGRFADIELLPPNGVRCTGAPVLVDLGGIAKGYAVDRAVNALRAAGAISGLVNAGGDVRAFGPEPQSIAIRFGGVVPGEVSLKNSAVAVSAPPSIHSPTEHRGFYSPHLGTPVPGRPVAIVARTTALADALTKCAILCSPEAFETLLHHYDARLVFSQA